MPSRSLPTRINPLLQPDATPQVELLVERRRLHQTFLSVKPGQVGTSNATKLENLGKFDYAHLRAPLPKDLTGSGIFSPTAGVPLPDSYFLMRRSSDGFVSATGMFKAAFPWSSKALEDLEKAFIKALPETDPQEVAGNIWVPPETALDLATDYNIVAWIEALLDPEAIELQSSSDPSKQIATPPRFVRKHKNPPTKSLTASPNDKMSATDSVSTRKKNYTRERSASPVKMSAPTPNSVTKVSPKKRASKKDKEASQDAPEKPAGSKRAKKASKALQDIVDGATTASEEIADSDADVVAIDVPAAAEIVTVDQNEGELPENTVRVTVQSDVNEDGENETTRTTVKVELPVDSPDLKLPKDTEGVIEKAREIVADAKDLQEQQADSAGTPASPKAPASRKSLKRKAEELELDLEGPEEIITEVVEPSKSPKTLDANGTVSKGEASHGRATKRTRVMVPAEEYRREKVRRRALMGLSGALAVGVMIPFLSNLF